MVRPFASAASLTVSLAGLLVGCDTVIVENLPGPRDSEAIVALDHATRNGAIRTVIIGNPFPGHKKAFDARVLRRMRGQNRGRPTDFVADSDRRTDPAYRVVVIFNPADGVTSGGMCRNNVALADRPDAGTLTMAIALCRGDQAISGGAGRATDLAGAGDSGFATLVGTVTRIMVQPKAPSLPRYRYYDGQYTHDDENNE